MFFRVIGFWRKLLAIESKLREIVIRELKHHSAFILSINRKNRNCFNLYIILSGFGYIQKLGRPTQVSLSQVNNFTCLLEAFQTLLLLIEIEKLTNVSTFIKVLFQWNKKRNYEERETLTFQGKCFYSSNFSSF